MLSDINPGELHGRSGAIQAAINLEMGSDYFHKIDVRLEGLNGQLPNLDLINTIAQLCKREGIPMTLQGRVYTIKLFYDLVISN